MFAPKVATPQTKTAEGSANRLARHRLGHTPAEQPLFLQRTIGNQATLRLLARRDLQPAGSAVTNDHEQKVATETTTDQEAPHSVSRDFSRNQLFQPEQASRAQLPSRPAEARLPGTIQAKLIVGDASDPHEHEADHVADQVMHMPDPRLSVIAPQLNRKCAACGADGEKTLRSNSAASAGPTDSKAPSIVHEVLRTSGQPLDKASRAFFEPRFGHDFSRVRVHMGAQAETSAQSVGALAYTVGSNLVFGPGLYSPHTERGRWLLAHELAHVMQNQAGAPNTLRREPPQAPGGTMDPRHARGYAGEQGMGFGYSSDKKWIIVDGPSGSAGHGVTTRGFDGVAYNIEADELHLIDNKSLNSETVHSTTALTTNLKKNLDGLIEKVERMRDTPSRIRILQLLKRMRTSLAQSKPLPKNTKLVVTGVGGRAKGVSEPLEALGVEVREPGVTDAPPSLAPDIPSPQAEPAPEIVTGETVKPPPETPKELTPTPKGKSGVVGGLFGVAAPLIAGFIHQRAVKRRIEERAHKEGYVPFGAPSGKGFLYDLGAWFIDPGNDADKAVGLDKRFDLPVWRQRLREIDKGKQPGEILEVQWDVGTCSIDTSGRQKIETRYVTYKKQIDGKWKVDSGDATGTPDLNDIISTSVSDEVMKSIISDSPCWPWA